MKKHLFYTFLTIFAATTLVTLLGVTGVAPIKEGYLPPLVSAFLIELGVAVVAIFKSADFFKEEDGRVSSEDKIWESIRKLDTAFGHNHDQLNAQYIHFTAEIFNAKYLGKTPRTDLQAAIHIVERYIDKVHPDQISGLLETMCDILESNTCISRSERARIVTFFNKLPDNFCGIKARFAAIENKA